MHNKHISIKISNAISILYGLKTIYPHLVLQTLYNTIIFPIFKYCILACGATISSFFATKALKLISNSNYIAHTELICKDLRLLKVTDMFSIAVWKFYYKLTNNQLPTYFVEWKPELSRVCVHYEIRGPVFHLPVIKHTFAEHSLRYCLVKQLKERSVPFSLHVKCIQTPFRITKYILKIKLLTAYVITKYIILYFWSSCDSGIICTYNLHTLVTY